MKFELKTLIDITKTDARRGDDIYECHQQQNFLTLFQTISLRANPFLTEKPSMQTQNIDNMNFGRKYKGAHTVWTLVFEFESESQHSTEMLNDDFNLVPVITGLEETVDLEFSAFITQSEESANIFFTECDK